METFSAVVKSATIRGIFSLATTYRWHIRHVDVNNIFLNGDLSERVYMVQPECFVDKT